MVDQTKMNDRSNGRGHSTLESTRSAARNMAHLLHDAVTLGQLQLQLLRLNCEQLKARLAAPLVALTIGLILTLFSVPMGLAGIALAFHFLAGFSWLEAVWSTFGIAFVIGLACVVYGVMLLRSIPNVFESSRVEWSQNIERLKEMLRKSSHPMQSFQRTQSAESAEQHFR
jgi:membrane-bound ClpP family serine protease